jgi:CheY-like chemotaxis protein
MGYQIDIAEDGEEALRKAKCHRYDLIFMDLHMPKMDGLQSSKLIFSYYKNQAVKPKIIALTASIIDQTRRDCQLAGMSDFMSKPIDAVALQNMLKKWGALSHEGATRSINQIDS